MKDLLELAQIVTPTKLRQVELLNASANGNGASKIQQFYEMLQNGTLESDEEAAQQFYNAPKSASSYQKLRGTVKDRLINSLFLIDLKKASYTDRQTAYYACYQEWAGAKILYGKNARSAAVSVSHKLLKLARKFEFTELLVDILHTLRLYYGTIEGDVKKFAQYNEAFKQQQQRWVAENLAEELYIDLSIGFVNAKATDTDIQEKAVRHFAQIKHSLEKNDTYQLHLCGRLIEVSQFTSINDYAGALDVCNRAIAFFETKKYNANVPLQIFHYQKLICHLQLQQYELALNAARKCESFLEEGTFNWFKLQETYFLLRARVGEYLQADEVVQLVLGHPGFGGLPENVRESWIIAEGYTYFIQKAGLIPEKTDAIAFRLSRFLNEMEVFSRDKKGMNITILILEFIIHIAERNYDYLIDRVEAVDKYRKRYLQSEETQRSAHFLKMLLLAPRCAFDVTALQKKAMEELHALQAIPIETANQSFEIEIIPYEELWETILDLLRKK